MVDIFLLLRLVVVVVVFFFTGTRDFFIILYARLFLSVRFPLKCNDGSHFFAEC